MRIVRAGVVVLAASLTALVFVCVVAPATLAGVCLMRLLTIRSDS